MTIEVQLRNVIENDFQIFFEHQRDSVAARMTAFGTKDPDASSLAERWKKSLADPSATRRAIVVGGNVVGYVATFMRERRPEVTYWVARSHWGRGIGTAALSQLLLCVMVRPI